MRAAAALAATGCAALIAGPAWGQGAAAGEVAELRALVRQQAQALQSLQRRLDGMEARQQAVRGRAAAAPGKQAALSTAEGGTPDVGGLRRASGGQVVAPGLRAPLTSGQQPGGGEVQPPGEAGTVEASPRQQAGQPPSPASPPLGQPPLPVLSGNDRVQVTVSGQVNRMVLVHGDGSGRVDSYFADNNVSSTRLRALGSARLDADTVGVSAIEFDLRSNSSASVSRQSVNNNGGDTPILGPFRVRRAEVGVQSATYGSLLLGRGSTFTDGIAEFDLSGTDVALYSYLPDSGGGLQFANGGRPYRRAGDPLVSQVYDDFDGPRDDRIRYDSPTWRGFTLGGSVGQGLYYDVGMKYAGEISGMKLAAGLGYMDYTGTLPSALSSGSSAQDGDNSPTTPFARRVAGSVAVLLPNGLSALASAGWGRHYGSCCGSGLVAREDSTTYYLKAGYQVSLFSFGKTNFSVDGGQTRNRIQDGDVASRFGLQVDQPVIAKGFELFAGWEHLMLRRTGARLRDGDIGLVGTRVQF